MNGRKVGAEERTQKNKIRDRSREGDLFPATSIDNEQLVVKVASEEC